MNWKTIGVIALGAVFFTQIMVPSNDAPIISALAHAVILTLFGLAFRATWDQEDR